MKSKYVPRLALAVLMALCLAPVPALAHKVSVFAYLEDGHIKGEGYFAGGDKAQESQVELLDPTGRVVAGGATDKQGMFSIALPLGTAGPLKVVLKAGMGHQGDYTLSAADLGQAGAESAPAPEQAAESKEAAPQAAAATAATALDSAQLEAALAKVLDKKLQPLNLEVAKLVGQKGVGLQDIVGGIGYIVGLMGLAAYLKTRKG